MAFGFSLFLFVLDQLCHISRDVYQISSIGTGSRMKTDLIIFFSQNQRVLPSDVNCGDSTDFSGLLGDLESEFDMVNCSCLDV